MVPDERTTRATARQDVIRMISDGKEKDSVYEHVNGVENIYTFAGNGDSLWQCGGVEGRHSKEQFWVIVHVLWPQLPGERRLQKIYLVIVAR